MRSYDGAEVCELVWLYLLSKLVPLIGTENVELYRDDSLAVIHQANGTKIDRIRKDIALFKSEGLSITIDTNLIETEFLDVLFNLEMEKISPYRKPNNTSLCIHSESNHPPSITKQLPSMTNRLNLSTNQLWKTAGVIIVWNSKHLLKTQDETEIGKSYGSIRHIA